MHTDCPVCTKNAKDKAAKAAKEEAGLDRRRAWVDAKLARGESLNPRTAELVIVAVWALQEQLAKYLEWEESFDAEHTCEGRKAFDDPCDACFVDTFGDDAQTLANLLNMFESTFTSMTLSFPEHSARIYASQSLREDVTREKARMAAEAQADAGPEPGQVLPFVHAEPEPAPEPVAVVRFREFL